MASHTYEETLVVPKRPLLVPPARRLTTQFAPERRVRWPWLVVAAVWIAAAVQPVDLQRSIRLSTHAEQLLQASSTAQR